MGANNDTEWSLVMVGATSGAAMAVSQTQETEQPPPGQQRQPPSTGAAAPPPTVHKEFSRIAMALKKQGHQNYDITVVTMEQSHQRDIHENTTKQTAFKEFATNYTQMRIYLAMLGKQKTVTMIHMLGTFYSIRASMNAYQGKVLGFVGDRRATKEPTPICLPQVKAWQWYAGQVNMDKEDFTTFFDDEANKNKWWWPSSTMTHEGRAPFLLALPNEMVEILRESGGAPTPADVMVAMDEVMLRIGRGITDDQWKTVIEWCLVASQSDANDRKSLLSIEVDSVTIDDDEFDTWVESKLDMALGQRPKKHTPTGGESQPPVQDHLQLPRLLASTVGQGMMQFTQDVAMQATTGGLGAIGQVTTPLKMSKGFNRDQIAKLKDACGVMAAKDIPNI
jgi:hypothetical protein